MACELNDDSMSLDSMSLDSMSADLGPSVHDDQASMPPNNTGIVMNGQDSTNTNQNVFEEERTVVVNSYTSTSSLVEHQCRGEGLRRQHSIDMPAGNMVDRQQLTVDDAGSHSTDYSSSSIVDKNKTILEDTIDGPSPDQFLNGKIQPKMASNIVDRQKRTVENDAPCPVYATGVNNGQVDITPINGATACSIIVDRQKRTVEDDSGSTQVTHTYSSDASETLGSQSNPQVNRSTRKMVDRQKRTVEDDTRSAQVTHVLSSDASETLGSQPNPQVNRSTHKMVDRQKRTVEDGPPSAPEMGEKSDITDTAPFTSTQPDHLASNSIGNMVDRQKRTVEDDSPSTQGAGVNNGVAITAQSNGVQPDHHVSSVGNMVDRQKRTVEDDKPTSHHNGVNNSVADITQITGAQASHNFSGRSQPSSGNMVDRQKRTVEDQKPTSHHNGVNNSGADITQITGAQANHNFSGRSQPSSCNMVDRQKRTVEDNLTSAQATGVNSSGIADTTQITGSQVNHHTSGHTQSAITGNMVDCQKRTVEDDKGLAQATPVNSPHVSSYPVNGVELEHQFEQSCGIADRRQQINSTLAGKWKIQLHVNVACSKDIMDYLPTSKCFKWNKAVVFGRGDSVDIFINDDHASRYHVELMGQSLPNQQVIFMMLNSSRQGYNLNGQNITDHNRWNVLKTGDQIKIAGLICVVNIVPGSGDMENFAVEFILPQVPPSPAMRMGGAAYSPTLLQIGQAGFFNHPVSPVGYMAPQLTSPYLHSAYLPPNNGMPPVQPNMHYAGVQPGQQPVPANITSDMVERVLQPYQERVGYIKFDHLRYLALEVVGEWEELGRALTPRLQDWQLTIINRDYVGVAAKSYHMLKTWVWQSPEQATLDNLRRALEDVTVGRADLVAKYCTEENGDGNGNDDNAEDANAPDSANNGESN